MAWSVIGGTPGYLMLRMLGRHVLDEQAKDAPAIPEYQGTTKLESLFGKDVWRHIAGKTVMDFGCGGGCEAVAMAKGGARRVIGIDSRQWVLDRAIERAEREGVSSLCDFRLETEEKADVIFSIDAFEHYDEPEMVLDLMRQLISPHGEILVSFGPPWLHPYGGHLFSVFPWAHMIFTERALIRWRSDFKSDGATRFHEVDGGLNQMTIAGFRQLVDDSDFTIAHFEAVPIRRLRLLHNRATQEFLTSVVRCGLRPRAASVV